MQKNLYHISLRSSTTRWPRPSTGLHRAEEASGLGQIPSVPYLRSRPTKSPEGCKASAGKLTWLHEELPHCASVLFSFFPGRPEVGEVKAIIYCIPTPNSLLILKVLSEQHWVLQGEMLNNLGHSSQRIQCEENTTKAPHLMLCRNLKPSPPNEGATEGLGRATLEAYMKCVSIPWDDVLSIFFICLHWY